MSILRIKALAILLVLFTSGAAFAQSWTAQTVKIIVPYPPGTEPDVLARELGNALSTSTGKTFVVDNKPGANSILGTDIVAKSDGDGATLLMVDRLAVVTNPLLYSKIPYQWESSLKPVSDIAGVNLFLGVRESLPVNNFQEFIKYVKANPKKINVGTGGNGHVNHIGMEMLAQANGLSFTYIPYKGVAPAVMGLLSGEVDVVMAGGLALQQQLKAGKIKVLVVGAPKRSMVLPDVPSIVEVGGKDGTIPSTVFALFASAKTPDAVVDQMNQAVVKVLESPKLRATFAVRAVDVAATSPAQTLSLMRAESSKYEKIIRDAGIKVE